MDKNFAIMTIAFFYTMAIFVAWIAKCDAIGKIMRGHKESKIIAAYPWILWFLTTMLAFVATKC